MGNVAPEVFFDSGLLRTQEGIGETDQANVMMPTQPVTPFVVVQTEFLLQFPVVEFDPPARFSDSNQAAHPRRLRWEMSHPVFAGLRFCLGPFHEQPLGHSLRMLLLTPSVSRPHRGHGKTR